MYVSSSIAPLPRIGGKGAKCLSKYTNFRPVVIGNIDIKRLHTVRDQRRISECKVELTVRVNESHLKAWQVLTVT